METQQEFGYQLMPHHLLLVQKLDPEVFLEETE